MNQHGLASLNRGVHLIDERVKQVARHARLTLIVVEWELDVMKMFRMEVVDLARHIDDPLDAECVERTSINGISHAAEIQQVR